MVEVALQLGSGSGIKSVMAMCLSEFFADIKNWSSDMNFSSRIQIEMDLFSYLDLCRKLQRTFTFHPY